MTVAETQSRPADASRIKASRTPVRRPASIRISRLAMRLGVAGETIRRDLIELGDAGLLNRTYGGATISLVTSEPVITERSQAMAEPIRHPGWSARYDNSRSRGPVSR